MFWFAMAIGCLYVLIVQCKELFKMAFGLRDDETGTGPLVFWTAFGLFILWLVWQVDTILKLRYTVYILIHVVGDKND